MTPSQVLRRAADYIEEHGWAQDTEVSHFGEVCTIAAMDVVCLHSCLLGLSLGGRLCVRCVAGDELRRATGDDDLARWNDTPGRTASEVISTLRRVADELEAGHV